MALQRTSQPCPVFYTRNLWENSRVAIIRAYPDASLTNSAQMTYKGYIAQWFIGGIQHRDHHHGLLCVIAIYVGMTTDSTVAVDWSLGWFAQKDSLKKKTARLESSPRSSLEQGPWQSQDWLNELEKRNRRGSFRQSMRVIIHKGGMSLRHSYIQFSKFDHRVAKRG